MLKIVEFQQGERQENVTEKWKGELKVSKNILRQIIINMKKRQTF